MKSEALSQVSAYYQKLWLAENTNVMLGTRVYSIAVGM